MADFTKISIDGTSYNVKDSTARALNDLTQIYNTANIKAYKCGAHLVNLTLLGAGIANNDNITNIHASLKPAQDIVLIVHDALTGTTKNLIVYNTGIMQITNPNGTPYTANISAIGSATYIV